MAFHNHHATGRIASGQHGEYVAVPVYAADSQIELQVGWNKSVVILRTDFSKLLVRPAPGGTDTCSVGKRIAAGVAGAEFAEFYDVRLEAVGRYSGL